MTGPTRQSSIKMNRATTAAQAELMYPSSNLSTNEKKNAQTGRNVGESNVNLRRLPEDCRFDAESKNGRGLIVSNEVGVDLIDKLKLVRCIVHVCLGRNQENPLMGKTSIVRPETKNLYKYTSCVTCLRSLPH